MHEGGNGSQPDELDAKETVDFNGNTISQMQQASAIPPSMWKTVSEPAGRVDLASDSNAESAKADLKLDFEAFQTYQRFTDELQSILLKYEAAMNEMVVRFEILDRDLSIRRNRNPIHHIESRVKSPLSIYDKLLRYGKEPTIANLEEYLMDVAGVRVICSYRSDVLNLMGLLQRQDDLEIVRIKDYINNPKPNGYRSMHAIVRIPVHFMDCTQMVPVEVQIRTIAMDYWASLEHDLRYKAVAKAEGLDIEQELKTCANELVDIEERMQRLANALDSVSAFSGLES